MLLINKLVFNLSGEFATDFYRRPPVDTENGISLRRWRWAITIEQHIYSYLCDTQTLDMPIK